MTCGFDGLRWLMWYVRLSARPDQLIPRAGFLFSQAFSKAFDDLTLHWVIGDECWMVLAPGNDVLVAIKA